LAIAGKWKAVCGNVVRDMEGFARQAFEEIAGDRLAWRKADRVHQAIQVIP